LSRTGDNDVNASELQQLEDGSGVGTRYLESLFNPSSIAVIGASERQNSLGGMVVRNLLAANYSGELLVVNERGYDAVHGVDCVRKVGRMPFLPELAIVCTPAPTVPKLVRQLGEMGVRSAIVMTGGMSRANSKSGRPLMFSVRDAARSTGIRLLGPNTIGLMVPARRLNATYAHLNASPGKVAFIGQSGAVASSVLDWAHARGAGFSYFLTLGDGMDIALDDLIDYLAQDRDTRAILLHIEQIPNPGRFMSAVRMASRTKPVIAVKSGCYPESEWHPYALPPALDRSDPVFDAFFRRAGALRVDGMSQMFDALETLTRMRPVRGESLVVLGNGVGPGIMAVDRLEQVDGKLAQLSDETIRSLAEVLPENWNRRNPIDLNYDATPELYREVIKRLGGDSSIANLLIVFSPTQASDGSAIAEEVIAASRQTRQNLITCWLGQTSVMKDRDAFYRAGLPSFFSPEKAVNAFMQHVLHQRVQKLLMETPESYTDYSADHGRTRRIVEKALREGRQYLLPEEASTVLKDYGIRMPDIYYCANEDEALAAFAVERKAVDILLVHEKGCLPFQRESMRASGLKGEHRKVASEASLLSACENLRARHEKEHPSSRFLGFGLQHYEEALEGIMFNVGLTYDEQFGPLVFCGASGQQFHVRRDRQIGFPPLNMALARELLRRSYMSRILEESSRNPERDQRALAGILVTLGQIAIDNPQIRNLEISSLLYNRDGALAMDVAIDLSSEPGHTIIQPYPAELEEQVVLPKSGRKVMIRPVRAEDEPSHREFHEHQSPESIRYRFFQYRKRFTHDDIAQMVQIDYDREMALVANGETENGLEETLGTVRVWTDADNLRSEFAVMVDDQLKGEGLGYLLMKKIIEYSRNRGTIEMVGTVLPENQPMIALGERLGFEVHRNTHDEVLELRLALNKPETDWQKERLSRQ